MLQIAGVQEGEQVVDPFCGSGTILIEAALSGAVSIGGDLKNEAVQRALLNSTSIHIRTYQGDVRHVPLPDNAIDYAISNMPWGRQVTVDDSLKQLYQQAFAEMRRIVAPSGKIVLLTTFPELLGAVPDNALEISLFGQNPQIVTFNMTR